MLRCSDHRTVVQMIEHYAKQVNQKKLAASAILKWERSGNAGLQN